MENLGDTIREARMLAGMTTRELAEKCGVSIAAISLWETGKNNPSPKAVKKLCEALPDFMRVMQPKAADKEAEKLRAALSRVRSVAFSDMAAEEKVDVIKDLLSREAE